MHLFKISIFSTLYFILSSNFSYGQNQSSLKETLIEHSKNNKDQLSTYIKNESNKSLLIDSLFYYTVNPPSSNTEFYTKRHLFELLKSQNKNIADKNIVRFIKSIDLKQSNQLYLYHSMYLANLIDLNNKDIRTTYFQKLKTIENPDLEFLFDLIQETNDPILASVIQQLKIENYHEASDKWLVWIIKAKSGDNEALNALIAQLNKLTLSDDLVLFYFPMLATIKNQRIYDYLLKQAENDKNICFNDLIEKHQPCTFQILSIMVPNIANIPFKTDITGELKDISTTAQVNEVLHWFQNNRNLEFK